MANKNWLTNKEYNFIYARVPRICVDLLIKDSRGVLLSLRDIEPAKNTWHLPGGRIKLRETIEQAAKRIAKEEVGLKIKVVDLIGVMEFPKEVQGGKSRHSISLALLVQPASGKPKGGWQASRIQFFKKFPPKTYNIHARFLRQKRYLV